MTAVLRQQFHLYTRIFSLGMQNSLVYRWNFLVRIVAGFVPLLGSVYLWRAVFQGAEATSFSGYNYHTMMAYFLSLIVLDALTSPVEDDFAIASDIRDGRISQVLLKPLNYFSYRLSLYCSSRLIYASVVIVPIGCVILYFRHFFAEVPLGVTLPYAMLAAFGSAMLQFTLTFATAMAAFWLLEIGSVVFILFSIEYLAGGHLFPIEVLPPYLYSICRVLPFAYEYNFPVGVLLGRIQGTDMWWGFLIQWAWVLFFFALGQALWRRGLKHYTSVGN